MLKWILGAIISTKAFAGVFLAVDMEEVYCGACIEGLSAKNLDGVKEVMPFEKKHFARFELTEDANPVKTLQALKNGLYTVEGASLIVDEPVIEQNQLVLKTLRLDIKGISKGQEIHRFRIHQEDGKTWLYVEKNQAFSND